MNKLAWITSDMIQRILWLSVGAAWSKWRSCGLKDDDACSWLVRLLLLPRVWMEAFMPSGAALVVQ